MNKKFIDYFNVEDYEILTDTGYEDIIGIHETVEYEKWIVKTKSYSIECADTHILFDKNMNEVFVCDLKIGDYVITENGKETIVYIENTFIKENMYDLELNFNSDRRYFANGFLNHNTQTMRSICKDMLELGIDCVYITLEMSEEKISQGIEANILDTPINDIPDGDMTVLKTKLSSHGKNKGKLWIKEWPTRGATTSSIRNYLDELKHKKEFEPKVVFVDYINILNSNLYEGSQEHLRVKSITEELRGLAVETKTAIITGTQTNRGGDNASDLSLKEIADSFGLTGTADAIVGIISTEELRQKGFLVYKLIKNRLGGVIDFKFPVRAESEYSRITNAKADEMPKLINSDESKGKMAALYEKFTRNELTKNENINKNINKEIDELTEDNIGVVFDVRRNKKLKKKVELKFEKEMENNEFANEID